MLLLLTVCLTFEEVLSQNFNFVKLFNNLVCLIYWLQKGSIHTDSDQQWMYFKDYE